MRENRPPHFTSANRPSPKSGLTTIAVWALAIIAAALALTGAYFLGVSNASVTEVEILIPTPAPAVVQVVGEVRAPGVYELGSDERVFIAIEVAGGATENADLERINLAAFVEDGARIVVPSIPPTPAPTIQISQDVDSSRNVDSAEQDTPATLAVDPINNEINLNSATLEQLKSLPGIGDTRANQILALRASIGRFSVLEQLLEINGIGEKTLEAIRPLVVLD